MTHLARALLLLLLPVVVQLPGDFSPRGHLTPRFEGMLTLPANGNAEAAYRLLAGRAGINVVFYPQFDGAKSFPVAIENLPFFDALDRVSAATGNFWLAWDARTIVVAPDTPANRRDLAPGVFKIVYLDGTPETTVANIISEVRARLQLRNLFRSTTSNGLVMFETPERIIQAEAQIADMTGAGTLLRTSPSIRILGSAGFHHVMGMEKGAIQRILPDDEAVFRNRFKTEITMDLSAPAAEIFQALGERAGLNIVIDPRLPPAQHRFNVSAVSIFDALDLLALQTRTMWQFLNGSTVGVREDTPTNRRDYDPVAVRLIYLSNTTTAAGRNEVLNVLRTSLGLRQLFSHDPSNAILIRDTPLRIELAERIIAGLVTSGIRPSSIPIQPPTGSRLTENGFVLASAQAARPLLDIQRSSLVNIRLNLLDARGLYQTLGELAGLQITSDSTFPTIPVVPLTLNGVDILDALDLLAWQTRTFWQVVDAKTIRVSENSPSNRRSLEPIGNAIIHPSDISPEGVTSTLNVLRTVLGLRDVQKNEKGEIVIADTADNIALAQEVVSALSRPR